MHDAGNLDEQQLAVPTDRIACQRRSQDDVEDDAGELLSFSFKMHGSGEIGTSMHIGR